MLGDDYKVAQASKRKPARLSDRHRGGGLDICGHARTDNPAPALQACQGSSTALKSKLDKKTRGTATVSLRVLFLVKGREGSAGRGQGRRTALRVREREAWGLVPKLLLAVNRYSTTANTQAKRWRRKDLMAESRSPPLSPSLRRGKEG